MHSRCFRVMDSSKSLGSFTSFRRISGCIKELETIVFGWHSFQYTIALLKHPIAMIYHNWGIQIINSRVHKQNYVLSCKGKICRSFACKYVFTLLNVRFCKKACVAKYQRLPNVGSNFFVCYEILNNNLNTPLRYIFCKYEGSLISQ